MLGNHLVGVADLLDALKGHRDLREGVGTRRGGRRTGKTGRDRDDSARDELGRLGLLDLGCTGPPSTYTPADLPAQNNLGAVGLLEPGGRATGQCLATAAPRDVLEMISLLG